MGKGYKARAKGGATRDRGIAALQRNRVAEAIPLLEQALRAQPRDPEAWHYLGMAYGRANRFDQAAQALGKCLELHPDSPPTLLMMAGALNALGRHDEALAALRKAVKLQPQFAEAHVEIGNILVARHDLAGARASFERAIKLNPKLATAHYGLGRVLNLLGGLEEAIAAYQKALQLDGNIPQLHFDIAQVLNLLGRTEKAKRHYRQARRLQPDYIAAIAGEAEVLEWERDYEGAWKLIRPLIEKGVLNAVIGRVYGQLCRRIDRCQEAADYLRRMLDLPDLPEKDRRELSFVLGKVLDRMGEYDEAFECFAEGNRRMRTTDYAPEQQTALVDHMMRVFSKAALGGLPDSGLKTELPVFIVGMPRSGTSLTEQILASHREVAGAGELPDIHRITQALGLATQGEQEYPLCVPKATPEMLASLAGEHLKKLEDIAQGARFVTDKMPQNFLHLGLISLLFPRSRVIHCRRDPRDNCLSIFFQNFSAAHGYANDLDHIARYYRDYERLMTHWKLTLDIPIFDLRYEDLVEDFEGTVRALLDFLGLDWDPAVLEFHKSRRIVGTASYDQVRQKIYRGSLGRWRHYEKHLGPLLSVLGRGEAG